VVERQVVRQGTVEIGPAARTVPAGADRRRRERALRNLWIVVPNVVPGKQTASRRNDNLPQVIYITGGRTRARTWDPLIKSQLREEGRARKDIAGQGRIKAEPGARPIAGLSIPGPEASSPKSAAHSAVGFFSNSALCLPSVESRTVSGQSEHR
jgi:hypothetical protein